MNAIRYKERSGTVVGMPGASRISNDELLTLKCDILVPAALENVITLHNAEAIKARIVAEAANGPTTPHADEILARRGVIVLPGHSGERRRRDRQLFRMGTESGRADLGSGRSEPAATKDYGSRV